MHTTRLARALAGAALAVTSVVGLASVPAQAQDSPTCNGTTTRNYSGFYAQMPTYNGSVTCTMFLDVQGSPVSTLQRNLNRCYGESLATDGSYGPLTKEAVRRAQTRDGVAVKDGNYGPYTRREMSFYGYVIVNGNPRYSCRVVG